MYKKLPIFVYTYTHTPLLHCSSASSYSAAYHSAQHSGYLFVPILLEMSQLTQRGKYLDKTKEKTFIVVPLPANIHLNSYNLHIDWVSSHTIVW